MEKHNSLEERDSLYLSFYCNLYNDIVNAFCVPAKESKRDLREIKDRASAEGLSFLTKTLPSLGKALDKALHSDTPLSAPSTFKRQWKRKTPELFRWFFTKVFDEDGNVLAMVNIDCIRALRQLVYFLYKLEIPHSVDQERKLLEEFCEVDKDLATDLDTSDEILKTASRIIDAIFWDFDFRDIRPKHGPGAVATGEKSWQKHQFTRLYQQIERVYPFTEYYQYNLSAVCDTYCQYEDLEILDSGTAKVVLVPKDSRGPRIISCEPLEYQWIQQGLGNAISAHLESHWCTSGQVNFTDQTINQRLALAASVDGSMATLDMKEASDRVSCKLVQRLFAGQPALLEALMATRSTRTVLPNGRVVHLNKFAPMGSCLCFPVEAVCFYVLAVAAVMHNAEFQAQVPHKGTREPGFHAGLRIARKLVHVYGDDIIVDQKFYPDLLQYFPTLRLRFNEDKCCTKGFFRESCGVDAYKGVNVTPLRLKKVWCHRTVDANILSSYTKFSNLAYERGFKQVSVLAARLVENEIGPLPVVKREGDCLALVRPVSVSQPPVFARKRFNKELQRVEYRGWAIRPVQVRTGTDSWSMVLRNMSFRISKEIKFDMFAQEHTQPGVYSVTRRSRLIRVWSSLE